MSQSDKEKPETLQISSANVVNRPLQFELRCLQLGSSGQKAFAVLRRLPEACDGEGPGLFWVYFWVFVGIFWFYVRGCCKNCKSHKDETNAEAAIGLF